MKRKNTWIYKRLFEKDDLYEMANIFPRTSGLPFIVRLSHKSGKEGHWARVKVEVDNNSYSVSISDNPEWIHKPKNVSEKKLNEVIEWIILNKQTLLDHWNGKIDSTELGLNLKKLS